MSEMLLKWQFLGYSKMCQSQAYHVFLSWRISGHTEKFNIVNQNGYFWDIFFQFTGVRGARVPGTILGSFQNMPKSIARISFSHGVGDF